MKVDNILKDKNGNSIYLPESINILSTEYTLEYYDNTTEVSSERTASFGEIDYYERIIRIYKRNNSQHLEILKFIMHEVIHGIIEELNIVEIKDNEKSESIIDQLSVGLIDTMIRNDMIKVKTK